MISSLIFPQSTHWKFSTRWIKLSTIPPVRSLGQIIDEAVKEQYGGLSPKPRPFSPGSKISDRQKYSDQFLSHLKNAGLPAPAEEHRFHPTRLWRFDFAYVEKKIAIEIDGGGWGRPVVCHRCRQTVLRFSNGRPYPVREGGRHHTAKGAESDNEKFNEAMRFGWRVLRFNPCHIKSGYALDLVKEILGAPESQKKVLAIDKTVL